MLDKDKIAVPPKQKADMNEAVQKPEANGAIPPIFMLPEPLRTWAGNQIIQGQETLNALNTATQDAYSNNLKALNEYRQKLVNAGQQDAEDAYNCWRELAAAKSLSEMIEIWTNHAPRQFNTMSSRTSELWTQFYKIATDATKPFANGKSHPLGGSK
jgi:hypothetical protein